MTEANKSLKRTVIGKVVSDKRSKTVTVLIERRVKHELYGKIVGKSSKYHAHDEKGEYKLGDVIETDGHAGDAIGNQGEEGHVIEMRGILSQLFAMEGKRIPAVVGLIDLLGVFIEDRGDIINLFADRLM